MGGLITRYMLIRVARGILLAFTIVTATIMLVDFVELSRTIPARADVSPLTLVGMTLLRAPSLVEATLPFVFLFGVMWSMFSLNRRSELVVMRAAGVSAWRFIAPAVALAVTAGVFATTLYNPAAARLSEEFEQRRMQAINPRAEQIRVSEEGVWLREARREARMVLRARTSRAGGSVLDGVTIYLYEIQRDGEAEFARRIDAQTAVLRAGFWQLTDAWEVAPDEDPVRHANLALPSDLEPSRLMERVRAPATLHFWELRAQARLLSDAGFSAVDYQLRWHRLLAAPLTLAAMTIVASAVSLRLARKGGAFILALLGVAIGFGLYFGESLLSALGATGVLPLVLATWTAPLAATLLGMYTIATLEDG